MHKSKGHSCHHGTLPHHSDLRHSNPRHSDPRTRWILTLDNFLDSHTNRHTRGLGSENHHRRSVNNAAARASAARSLRLRAERAREAEAALALSRAQNVTLQEQLAAALRIIEQLGYSAPLAALAAMELLLALEPPSPSELVGEFVQTLVLLQKT